MNSKLVLLLVLLAGGVQAQNTIRVRPQHYKEHIYSLKNNEHLIINESNIQFDIKGTNYVFSTRYNGNIYKNSRGNRTLFKSNYYRSRYPRSYKNWRIKTVGKRDKLVNKTTGKTYGPYDYAHYMYDWQLPVETKGKDKRTESDLFGALYHIKGAPDTAASGRIMYPDLQMFVVRPGEAPAGPFEEARIYRADANQFVYRFKRDGETFLQINDEQFGPYDYAEYFSCDLPECEAPYMFFYKKGSDWYSSDEKLKNYVFTQRPTFLKKGFKASHVKGSPDKEYFIYFDGQIREDSYALFSDFNNNGEELLFQLDESEQTTSYDRIFEVSYNDSLIGRFRTYKYQSIPIRLNRSDFFNRILLKTDRDGETFADNGVYFFSPTQGLIGPYKNDRNNWLFLFEEEQFLYNRNDSTLTLSNGEKYDQVLGIEFNEYPKQWWMVRRNGDLDYAYKNGEVYKGRNYPDYFKRFRMADKPFVLVKRGEEYFVKPQGRTKLLGPVKHNSQIILAGNKNDYIECMLGTGIVQVNGKAVSEGFNAVYNPEFNAFNWASLDEKRNIYLHTYELD